MKKNYRNDDGSVDVGKRRLGGNAGGCAYEANVGENTPIGIPRAGSPNALWTQGGILYAPPMR